MIAYFPVLSGKSSAMTQVLRISNRLRTAISFGGVVSLFVAFLLPLHGYSQIDFRPGYIVELNGDTVKGFVAYRKKKIDSREAAFRQSSKGPVTRYSPAQISAFGIYDIIAHRSVDLPPGAPDTGRAFAKVLTQGYYTLYRYQNLYLLDAHDSLITLPPPKNEPVGGPDSKVVKRVKRYIGILNYVLLDCQQNANEASFSDAALVEVIDRYNACKENKPMPNQKYRGLNVDFMVFGGYSAAVMTYDYLRKVSFDGNNPTGGVGVELSYPRGFDKLRLSVEAVLIRRLYQGFWDQAFVNEMVRQDIFVNITSIRIPFGFRYNLKAPDATPYFRGGLSWEPRISSSVRTIEERELNTGEVLTREFDGGFDYKNPKGFWLAAGYNKRLVSAYELFAEVRYTMTQGYVGSALIDDSRNRSFDFLVGIRF